VAHAGVGWGRRAWGPEGSVRPQPRSIIDDEGSRPHRGTDHLTTGSTWGSLGEDALKGVGASLGRHLRSLEIGIALGTV